MLAINLHYTAH